jgi:hypothetical protein
MFFIIKVRENDLVDFRQEGHVSSIMMIAQRTIIDRKSIPPERNTAMRRNELFTAEIESIKQHLCLIAFSFSFLTTGAPPSPLKEYPAPTKAPLLKSKHQHSFLTLVNAWNKKGTFDLLSLCSEADTAPFFRALSRIFLGSTTLCPLPPPRPS